LYVSAVLVPLGLGTLIPCKPVTVKGRLFPESAPWETSPEIVTAALLRVPVAEYQIPVPVTLVACVARGVHEVPFHVSTKFVVGAVALTA
jgi:hypothetical protein